MNQAMQKYLSAILLLAVVAIALQTEAKADKVPKNCDPELGCIEVR